MSLSFFTIPTKTLAASINASAMSFQVENILDWNGDALLPADFGTEAYGLFRNDNNTIIEIFAYDPSTISSSSVTILRRGLKFNGVLLTEDSDYKLTWIKNETFVELGSHPPQIFQWLKEYIDAASIAGAVNATSSVKGIVEIATQAEIDAGTATGGTGASISVTPDQLAISKYNRGTDYFTYAADSVGTDSYAITVAPAPSSLVAGMTFKLKVGTSNTGAATLNVNGLGATTIKKNVSDDLVTGDIIANQIVLVTYDGTNFQLLGKTDKAVDIQVFTSSGTWTKRDGATAVDVICIGGGGGGGRANTSTANAGGGGGGGYMRKLILPALTAGTETVTVGTGGPGASANNTSGTAGGASTFGIFVKASGGLAGTPTAGGIGGGGMGAGSAVTTAAGLGGAGGASGDGVTGGAGGAFGAAGGGSGGSSAGSAGGAGGAQAFRGTTVAGGTAGTSNGGTGGAATGITSNEPYPGAGGGGGGGNGSGAGGAGGAGGTYGGGGGAGGSGVTSGNGGAGADGIVVAVTYF